MNEFKSRQVPTKEELEKVREEEKQRREIEEKLKVMWDRKKCATKELIYLFYKNNGKLNDLQKEKFLAIDETAIPTGTYLLLYHAAKEYIEKGKISEFEEYKERYIKKSGEPVLLDQVPEKWRKDPRDKDETR